MNSALQSVFILPEESHIDFKHSQGGGPLVTKSATSVPPNADKATDAKIHGRVMPFDQDIGYTSTIMSEEHANPNTLPTALATARSDTDPIPETCKVDFHTTPMPPNTHNSA
jgi:hypothetical protein